MVTQEKAFRGYDLNNITNSYPRLSTELTAKTFMVEFPQMCSCQVLATRARFRPRTWNSLEHG